GGVDVLFVVSGFLITTSLLSKYARDGYIQFFNFIGGLLKRLLPQAVTVLIFVTVVSYFILPEVRHIDTIKEIFASLFYYETGSWPLQVRTTLIRIMQRARYSISGQCQSRDNFISYGF